MCLNHSQGLDESLIFFVFIFSLSKLSPCLHLLPVTAAGLVYDAIIVLTQMDANVGDTETYL